MSVYSDTIGFRKHEWDHGSSWPLRRHYVNNIFIQHHFKKASGRLTWLNPFQFVWSSFLGGTVSSVLGMQGQVYTSNIHKLSMKTNKINVMLTSIRTLSASSCTLISSAGSKGLSSKSSSRFMIGCLCSLRYGPQTELGMLTRRRWWPSS